jgi:hypothetical protein
MQERHWAHLIKCNVNLIPFLQTLIGYMKEQKLAAPIWGGHPHITKMVDWDSPKGDVSRFIRMLQNHMCYNMSVISVKVRGILDLDASAEILCPTTGNVLEHLSLWQTLMKYLALQNGTPMCTELHQCGLQGPVDMVIPNTAVAEAGFEMFNKQPAGYLYHVIPTFGAPPLFVKTILCQLMEAGLTTEASLCMYDPKTQILTTPRDVAQDGVLSDLRSLPFFQDVLANKQEANANKKGKKKGHTAPKICFQLGSARSIQTVHGANDGNYSKVLSQALI